MNKIILIGRLTKDPELRTTQSGIVVTNFSIAVNRPFTNQDGERGVDYFNCIIWRKPAENVAKYCEKGSQICIEGRIENRSYDDKDGNKKYVTEVQCENVTFLGNSKSDKPTNEDSISGSYDAQLSDSDLPF